MEVVQMNPSFPIVDDCEGEVKCVRYCMAFAIILLVGLVVDPLPKLFPGFFLGKLVFLLWTLYRSSSIERARH